ncbi:hypothetical protein NUU61_010061 [Penicillium alfredii]|uniref:Uncharacterized protein n=1 Tax=Penicillium alfredii TaxID=1506179 RepID=A0A9W9JUN0_9EURO|nr:uncharacterized protein NUU61_010061 [Penicillium alfredii]KAJ5081797.1 hypothetical protein NUU61_010061 [Penicillium alfredii]
MRSTPKPHSTPRAKQAASSTLPTKPRGAYLVVDLTFGRPGIQDPFALDADTIMHSGTKYFGGHNDLLCGTLSIPPEREEAWLKRLHEQRTILGSVLDDSENATCLVRWIAEFLKSVEDNAMKSTVSAARHASLQDADMDWLREQTPNGFGPVLGLEMKTEGMTRRLTGLLDLFQHATSLGGVESQIEWRRLIDPSSRPTLLRVSVSVEHIDDLKADLLQGFESMLQPTRV